LDAVVSPDVDPIVARRVRIARFVKIAQRVGYSALLVAIVAFVAAIASDFPNWLVTVTVVALVAGIIVLPVPIILGYGVRAADREERQRRSERG
jgi:hypothetical protein